MRKKITVDLSSKGIETLLKEIREYKKWLKRTTEDYIQRLAEEGCQVASVNFQQAQYDGNNDVAVSVENRGEMTTAVVAIGNATLFIEFGTGINYSDNHPEAGEHGMNRGTFGYGLGRLKSWRYTGEAGTNGEIITTGKHAGEVRTKGNPANMALYSAIKDLEERLTEIAREVFK